MPGLPALAMRARAKALLAAVQARAARYTVTRPDQTFATFNTRDVAQPVRTAYAVAAAFAEAPRGWLVLHGPPGTGKSHLASAIANACEGRSVLSLVMPDLLQVLRSGFDRGDHDEVLDLCRTVDLLIIDDIGTESSTPWVYEKTFQIVNHRYSHRMPTVFIFNGVVDDFDARIASRMKDRSLTTLVPVYGEDYRSRVTRRP